MFNVRFFSRRRTRNSSDAREHRQNRFLIVAILIGIILAVAFGVVLYSMNVAGRI